MAKQIVSRLMMSIQKEAEKHAFAPEKMQRELGNYLHTTTFIQLWIYRSLLAICTIFNNSRLNWGGEGRGDTQWASRRGTLRILCWNRSEYTILKTLKVKGVGWIQNCSFHSCTLTFLWNRNFNYSNVQCCLNFLEMFLMLQSAQ